MNQAKPKNTGDRISIIMIIALPIIIILASTFVYFTGVGMPEGTSNQGVLIDPPIALSDLELAPVNEVSRDKLSDPLWALAMVAINGCEQQCQDNLVKTRQMHIALGRLTPDVRRVLIAENEVQAKRLLGQLSAEHPKLHVAYASGDGWRLLLERLEAYGAAQNYFLLDPREFAMMYYPPALDGKLAMKDLKFLLKN